MLAAMKTGTACILLGVVLLLAAMLRFTALDFGESRVNVRPDEDAVPLTLLGMERDALMPPLVVYGGGYFYPLRAFIWAWENADLSLPDGANLLPGAQRVRIARWWSSILSFLTVVLTFVAGYRLGRVETGLLASLLVATSTLAVREAHFGKADSAAAFAALLFLIVAAESVARDKPRAVVVGIVLGYAMSNKASIGLLIPAAYVFLRGLGADPWRVHGRRLVVAAAVCTIAVLVLNPHWITHPAEALVVAQHTLGQVADNSWLAGSAAVPGPLAYHSQISLRYGGGLFLTWLAVPAIVYGLFRSPVTRLISLCILGPFLVFASSPMVLARFMLPLLAPLVLLVAMAVTEATAMIRGRGREVVLFLVGIALAAGPTLRSWSVVELLGRRDTRLLASDWIEENLPPGEILVSWGTPPKSLADWGGVPAGGRPVYRNLEPTQWESSGVGHLVWHSYPLAYSSVPPPQELASMAPVVVFEAFDGPLDGPVLEAMDAFYLPLGRLEGIARPGPRIAIYDVSGGRPAP